MRKLNKELGKMVFVSIPMVLQPLLNFCFLLLVARFSSLAEYGSLALALVLMSVIVGFSDLGLRDYLLSKGAIRKGLSSGENLFLPASLGFLALAAGSLLYLQFIGDTRTSLHLLAWLLPEAFAFGVLQRSLFFHYQKQNELVRFSSIDALHKSLPFVVKLAVFWSTRDLVLAVALGSLVALGSYLTWFYSQCVRRSTFFAAGSRAFGSLGTVLAAWRSWLPFTVSFLSFFLYFGADRILIEALIGTEPLAIYAAAYSFIAVGQIAVTAFWSLYMPRISRGEAVFGQKTFILIAMALSLVMVLCYQIFAFNFFGLFYPDTYAEAALILSVLSGFFIFRLVNVVFEMHWVAKERYTAFVKARVTCGLVSIVLNLVFIPIYGLLAPAVIIVIAEGLLTLFILAAERQWKKTLLRAEAQ